jgi:hypothetical protein
MTSTQTDLNAARVILAGQKQGPLIKKFGGVFGLTGPGNDIFNRFLNGQTNQPYTPKVALTPGTNAPADTNVDANQDGSADVGPRNVAGDPSNKDLEKMNKDDKAQTNKTVTEGNPTVIPAAVDKTKTQIDGNEKSSLVYYVGAGLVAVTAIYFLIKFK